MISLLKRKDALASFDELLNDQDYWDEYAEEIATTITRLMVDIFVAGAEVAMALPARVKAYREKAPKLLSDTEVEQLALQAISDYVPTFTKNITATTYDTIKDAVRNARLSGGGVEEVLAKIEPVFGPKRSENIAITETTRLFGQGSQAVYRVQGLTEWEWQSANDPWTDVDCQGKQGERYPMTTPFDPEHPRCRCWPAPVYTSAIATPIPEVMTESAVPAGVVIGFDKNPRDYARYRGAPDLSAHMVDVAGSNKVRAALDVQGRLVEKRYVEFFHITPTENVATIQSQGLIPAARTAPGQPFAASYSEHSVYFHSSREAALADLERARELGEDWSIVSAKIPITPKTLNRILPDEDLGLRIFEGAQAVVDGEAVAFIGGVPAEALSVGL